jgi:hypothetical protein
LERNTFLPTRCPPSVSPSPCSVKGTSLNAVSRTALNYELLSATHFSYPLKLVTIYVHNSTEQNHDCHFLFRTATLICEALNLDSMTRDLAGQCRRTPADDVTRKEILRAGLCRYKFTFAFLRMLPSPLTSIKVVGCSCQWGETMSELWPPTGPLFVPQIYEYGEPRWNFTAEKSLLNGCGLRVNCTSSIRLSLTKSL